MKKIIAIIMCFLSSFCFLSCNEKLMIDDTNIVSGLQEKINLITQKYYLKYTDKNFVYDDVKQELYVEVAKDFKSAYSVSFGSCTFDSKEKVKFNIGNNSYIYTLAFYKKGKSLYVFAPLLAIEGGNTKTLLFCVDGLYFSVKIYDGEYNKLNIDNVQSLSSGEAKNEKNIANRDVITHSISDIKTKLGINLKIDNNAIPQNSILFIRKSYQNYSDPTEYLIYQNTNEYTIQLSHDDSKQELQKGETRNIDIYCTLFGGGSIGFDLNIKLN